MSTQNDAPNRIRELRKRAGLTTTQLAELVGTAQSTIARLETGARQLTAEWMEKIAAALNVEPQALLNSISSQSFNEDAQAYYSSNGKSELLSDLSDHGICYFTIKSDVLTGIGIKPGDRLLFNMKPPEDPSEIPVGSVVIAQVHDADTLNSGTTVVRQFLPPDKLVTNTAGLNNSVVSLLEPKLDIVIMGVHVPRKGA